MIPITANGLYVTNPQTPYPDGVEPVFSGSESASASASASATATGSQSTPNPPYTPSASSKLKRRANTTPDDLRASLSNQIETTMQGHQQSPSEESSIAITTLNAAATSLQNSANQIAGLYVQFHSLLNQHQVKQSDTKQSAEELDIYSNMLKALEKNDRLTQENAKLKDELAKTKRELDLLRGTAPSTPVTPSLTPMPQPNSNAGSTGEVDPGLAPATPSVSLLPSFVEKMFGPNDGKYITPK